MARLGSRGTSHSVPETSMRTVVLLVDGTNLVMRAAYGGEIAADVAVETAARLIVRASRMVHATHQIVAFDPAPPSWRRQLDPSYKAHRTTETHAYSRAALERFQSIGWQSLMVPGFEADDVLATLAARAVGQTVLCSGDSDLLACIRPGVTALRPIPGGKFEVWDVAQVEAKYGVTPEQLADYKALTGEPGDNITGVRGIGPKKAAALLQLHGSLDRLLAAEIPDSSNEAARVRNEGRDIVRAARRLTTLRTDVPLPPIARSACRLSVERAA